MAVILPEYFSTKDAAAYLGWPKSRLHDRAVVGLVKPQNTGGANIYSKRQLYIYKKTGYNQWPDTIDAEIVLTDNEAAEYLSALWGFKVSAWRLRRYSTKYGVPQRHKVGISRFFSKGEIRQFSIFYKRALDKRKVKNNEDSDVQGTNAKPENG